jgi:hypothetical protein
MDGQVLKLFFQTLFEGTKTTSKKPKKDPEIERTEIPTQWRSSVGTIATSQTQCDYLQQFWEKRWVGQPNASMYRPRSISSPSITSGISSSKHGLIFAVTYLLSESPGKTYPTEFLFLPGRLNVKKSALFSVKPKNVIGLEKFKKMPLHQRIDELREVVLLTAVSHTYAYKFSKLFN